MTDEQVQRKAKEWMDNHNPTEVYSAVAKDLPLAIISQMALLDIFNERMSKLETKVLKLETKEKLRDGRSMERDPGKEGEKSQEEGQEGGEKAT